MSLMQAFGPALLLGLFGSTHCIGMCGGLSGALAFALPPGASTSRRLLLLGAMGLGRISSYALLGALAGALLPGAVGGLPLARIVAGVLLALMGLSIAGWSTALAPLERAGHQAWQRIGPRALKRGRIDAVGTALLTGMAWGWLPCGLVYSTLAWAASGGESARGAVLMLGFGLGTLPAVMASGAMAASLRATLQRRELRAVIGLLLIGFGIWTIAAALRHGGHAQHTQLEMHNHHGHEHPPGTQPGG
jgi:sulfite exporter TauE/SafE